MCGCYHRNRSFNRAGSRSLYRSTRLVYKGVEQILRPWGGPVRAPSVSGPAVSRAGLHKRSDNLSHACAAPTTGVSRIRHQACVSAPPSVAVLMRMSHAWGAVDLVTTSPGRQRARRHRGEKLDVQPGGTFGVTTFAEADPGGNICEETADCAVGTCRPLRPERPQERRLRRGRLPVVLEKFTSASPAGAGARIHVMAVAVAAAAIGLLGAGWSVLRRVRRASAPPA